MRVVFFGTSSFAVPAMNAIHNSSHEIISVVSQPDKPTGRGLSVHKTPIKVAAEELNLIVHAPIKARAPEFIELMQQEKPDVFVVAAYGQILSQKLLDIPKYGGINLHGSMLPKYRGAAPIQRAIMEGEKQTGITIMKMDRGMDTGAIGEIKSINIEPVDNYGTLTFKLAELAAGMIVPVLDNIDKIIWTPQDNESATYAHMIKREEGLINWESSADSIVNLIRAFNPKPTSYTTYEGKAVKIWQASVVEFSGNPGDVLSIKPDVVVGCGDHSLKLFTVQPEGKAKMSASDWVNGARIKPGIKLGSFRNKEQ